MSTSHCAVCSIECELKCGRCGEISYCSKDHQNQHWPAHKSACSKFRMEDDPTSIKAKKCIANMDLKPGQILLDEAPIVYGPLYTIDHFGVPCAACCYVIKSELYYCTRCELPLCGPECESNPIHADNECKIFSKFQKNDRFNFLFDNPLLQTFQFTLIVMMIRCASIFHETLRDLPQSYLNNETATSALKIFQRVAGLNDASISYDDCNRIMKIIMHNGFSNDINGYVVAGGCVMAKLESYTVNMWNPSHRLNKSIALFKKASRLNYSCVPNCTWTICPEKNYKIRIRACVPIRKGEEIRIACPTLRSYYCGTVKRQQIYKSVYGVLCTCERCMDRTERGHYTSAITCDSTVCRAKLDESDDGECGYFLPKSPLHQSPDAVWVCSECKSTVKQEEIVGVLRDTSDSISSTIFAHEELHDLQNALKLVLKAFSRKCFHPNHEILGKTIIVALQLLGQIQVQTKEDAQERIEWNKYILRYWDVMAPGLSNSRARVLAELGGSILRKMHIFGNTSSAEEMLPDLALLMKVCKEAFLYYMDEMCGPGKDINDTATLVYDIMTSATHKWRSKAASMDVTITDESGFEELIAFLGIFDQTVDAKELKTALKKKL